jgi:hypothetical protein
MTLANRRFVLIETDTAQVAEWGTGPWRVASHASLAPTNQRTGRNIYFQPNETSLDCARKRRKADMAVVKCRFADIDPDDEHHQLADERDRLRRLAEMAWP